jgi:hypothetical protein
MKLQTNIKHEIFSLFDVTATENGGWCVVTPMQYSGSNDHVVVHIRPTEHGWELHDNGDAVLNANMLGFDTDTDALERWTEDLKVYGPTHFDAATESLVADTEQDRLLAPYIFRVAEAAQQFFAIATQRHERRASNFKEQVAKVVTSVGAMLNLPVGQDIELPIAGGFKADFVIDRPTPLVIIAATSASRLMEAQLIFMQYRYEKVPGFVLAIAESPQAVGRKQFDRANYYTGKTVSFDPSHLSDLIKDCLAA